MRTKTFTDWEASDVPAVFELAPWAQRVIKVEGGFMAFESREDYRIWKNQQ